MNLKNEKYGKTAFPSNSCRNLTASTCQRKKTQVYFDISSWNLRGAKEFRSICSKLFVQKQINHKIWASLHTKLPVQVCLLWTPAAQLARWTRRQPQPISLGVCGRKQYSSGISWDLLFNYHRNTAEILESSWVTDSVT